MARATAEKQYICPGETHPITRSVHLARMAACFPACRSCPLRVDAGQAPGRTVERLERVRRHDPRMMVFGAEGVRGVHLNGLTRAKGADLAGAFAALLWNRAPLVARKDGARKGSRPKRPIVVVGHDERSSSPDLVTGVVAGLRRTGCQVIDISLSTRACFAFTVEHVQAQGGVFVTGNGCGPSWTGLDFVGGGGQPISRRSPDTSPGEMTLDELADSVREPFHRPLRHAGPYRTFQAVVPYEASLWKQFHALRPLLVAVACPSRLVRQTLERVFATLPCRMISVAVPLRVRQMEDPEDADAVRLHAAVREAGADLGVLLDDDGCRCAFFDERGVLVCANDVTRLLAEHVLLENPGSGIALETATWEILHSAIERRGGSCVNAGRTMSDMFGAMHGAGALFGGGGSGRAWFDESVPTCDAILTVARMLQVLSRSDATFSEVVRAAQRDIGSQESAPA